MPVCPSSSGPRLGRTRTSSWSLRSTRGRHTTTGAASTCTRARARRRRSPSTGPTRCVIGSRISTTRSSAFSTSSDTTLPTRRMPTSTRHVVSSPATRSWSSPRTASTGRRSSGTASRRHGGSERALPSWVGTRATGRFATRTATRRVLELHRSASGDPNPNPRQKTVRWRDEPLNRPECTLDRDAVAGR